MSYARRGLRGLDPSDSCYDQNRPWYVPSFWLDDAECACIAAQGRPAGEQCFSTTGVPGLMQVMGTQAGDVVGGAVGGVLGGVASGAAEAAKKAADNAGLSGMILVGVLAVGALMVLPVILGRR